MKTIFTLFILLTTVITLNAQNIRGYSDATIDGSGFSYDVQLSFTAMETNNTLHTGGWIVKLISVKPDSKGYYSKGKTNRYYSCSELGNICNPSKFTDVLVNVNYQCANNESKLIVLKNINEEIKIVVRQKPNTTCNIRLENVKVRNNADASMYRKRINEIEYPQKNTNTINNNTPSSSSNNSATSSGSSTQLLINGQENKPSPNNTQNSNTESDKHILKPSDIGITDEKSSSFGSSNPMIKYNPVIPTGNSTLDNIQKGYQQGQQIADIATGIVDLLAPTPAQLQKRAAATAEYERLKDIRITNELNEAKEKFGRLYYYPLIEKAKKGDENARMTLYFASEQLYSKRFVPLREEWFNEALVNKNLDALMEKAAQAIKAGKDGVPHLAYAAKLGNVDAMVKLALTFDLSSTLYVGSNAKFALEWLLRGAENGSPNAMYYLGMIYKYGIIEDLSEGGIRNYRKKMHVEYNLEMDEKKAFEWFSKSIQPDYVESLYTKGIRSYTNNKGSYFEKKSYKELALMYKQGKVVAKDKQKAIKYENSYTTYKEPEF